MTTLESIRTASAEYDKTKKQSRSDLTRRFKALVAKHGVSMVAAAAGLRESSVSQYNRCAFVPVSEYTIIKAETILNK